MDIKSRRIHLSLACPICSEDFNTEQNQPLILSCGHTLCSRCITTLYASLGFKCPMDKKNIVYTNINRIPKNFLIIQELEGQKESRGCRQHDHTFRFYCKTESQFKCQDCIALTCLFQKHDLAPAEEYDTIIPLREKLAYQRDWLLKKFDQISDERRKLDLDLGKLLNLKDEGLNKPFYTQGILNQISHTVSSIKAAQEFQELQIKKISNSIEKTTEFQNQIEGDNWRGLKSENIDKVIAWSRNLDDCIEDRSRISELYKYVKNKTFESLQLDLNKNVWPLLEGKIHVFKWKYQASFDVQVTGDWCDWTDRFSLKLSDGLWVSNPILIKKGATTTFKFIVDGKWCFDIEDYNKNENGLINNYVPI